MKRPGIGGTIRAQVASEVQSGSRMISSRMINKRSRALGPALVAFSGAMRTRLLKVVMAAPVIAAITAGSLAIKWLHHTQASFGVVVAVMLFSIEH